MPNDYYSKNRYMVIHLSIVPRRLLLTSTCTSLITFLKLHHSILATNLSALHAAQLYEFMYYIIELICVSQYIIEHLGCSLTIELFRMMMMHQFIQNVVVASHTT